MQKKILVIEEDPSEPRYVLTEYGVGYRFEKAK